VAKRKRKPVGKDGPALDTDFFRRVGGRPRVLGGPAGSEPVWDFGLVPEQLKSAEQRSKEAAAVAAMPPFRIEGTQADPDRVALYDLWRHPDVVKLIGFEYPGVRQVSGACVGAGGGNALFSLLCADALIRGEPEHILVPFWLLPYGWSRYHSGFYYPGEGSSGAGFAKAVRENGVVPAGSPGLPPYQNQDGLCWGKETEIAWSDGDDQPAAWQPPAKQHLVQTTARCRNADDVIAAIRNYYPCTTASMYAFKASVTSDPPVLLARAQGQWCHQMSMHAAWKHPKLGWILWLQNQWGDYHGHDPAGGPKGGAWIIAADVTWMCQTGEVYAFSGLAGFPARTFSWCA
jgi:hypothetical protein